MRRDVGRYLTTLAGLHLTDADVIRPTSPARLLRSAFWIAVLVVAPGRARRRHRAGQRVARRCSSLLVSLLVKTPVSKGTARVLVGPRRVPDRVDHRRGAGRRRRRSRVTLVVITAAVGALAAIWMVERALGARVDAAALAGAARAHRHGRPGRGGARRRGRHGARRSPAPS